MRAVRFQPGALDVAPGDRITWTNHDVVPHTVTAADASWDSGRVPPGGTFTWVVEGSGTVPYVCSYHATMRGHLRVP
jgi:plastocyanin